MGNCKNQILWCIICSLPYKIKEYCYWVAGYIKGKKKICIYMTAKYTNCGGNYIANSLQCISRHKTDIELRRYKKK